MTDLEKQLIKDIIRNIDRQINWFTWMSSFNVNIIGYDNLYALEDNLEFLRESKQKYMNML